MKRGRRDGAQREGAADPGARKPAWRRKQRFRLFERKRGARAAVPHLLSSPPALRGAARDRRARAGARRDHRGGGEPPGGIASRARGADDGDRRAPVRRRGADRFRVARGGAWRHRACPWRSRPDCDLVAARRHGRPVGGAARWHPAAGSGRRRHRSRDGARHIARADHRHPGCGRRAIRRRSSRRGGRAAADRRAWQQQPRRPTLGGIVRNHAGRSGRDGGAQ